VCIRCRGNILTESLPSNDKGIQILAHRLVRGIFKYTVETGSGAMIDIPSFIKIGSEIHE
jgi:hypothetical protein